MAAAPNPARAAGFRPRRRGLAGSAGAPEPWAVRLPKGADLVVLDTAPLWLGGRVVMHGRLLFEDDPAARVAWQGDTRLLYLDEIPAVQERYREWRRQLAQGSQDG
ncbi:MAG: hypothetical protein ACREQM_01565 [Candidatus Dormibacteraceae bacterium]